MGNVLQHEFQTHAELEVDDIEARYLRWRGRERRRRSRADLLGVLIFLGATFVAGIAACSVAGVVLYGVLRALHWLVVG